ncbi:MAG TPA: hypothetical protein VFG72_03815 [Marmoricola sp.]|nr:hypothetical protein [Marmoricola sp.]
MSSMLYTMGMALDRAAENGFSVRLLVEGAWLEGHVAGNDGVGVVLENTQGMHSVVRTERISAVQVTAESPYRTPLNRGSSSAAFDDEDDLVRPMPGPRATVAV